MNRRGQVPFVAVILLIIIFLLLAFIGVSSLLGASQINTMVQNSDMSNESKQAMQSNVNSQPLVFDAGAVFVVVIAWLMCLGFAYNAADNPFMIVAAIVIIVSLGFTGMLLSNVWDKFYSDSGVNAYAVQYPMTNFFLQHYLILILVISFSTLIVYMYNQGGR